MNREILIDALANLDGGLIERYYEIKGNLQKKRINRKMMMKWALSAACVALVVCVAIPLILQITDIPELPVDETTVGGEEVTTDPPGNTTTEEPIIDDPPVFDPSKVIHGRYYLLNNGDADLRYNDWNGLEISDDLEWILQLFNDSNIANKEYMYAINVFRRDGEDFYSTYQYEGKTWGELSERSTHPIRQISRLRTLLDYGDILKYGKEILSTTGVPEDEPIVEIRGRGLTEKTYDDIVDCINYYDPLTLPRYIVDGVFLKEKAQEDYDTYCLIKVEFENKWKEMRNAYFCRYEPEDVALFEDLGFITGEINGKLYIIVSYDQFSNLGKNAKMSKFTFVPLPEDDFYTAYSDK